jgi:hypothetical protein
VVEVLRIVVELQTVVILGLLEWMIVPVAEAEPPAIDPTPPH